MSGCLTGTADVMFRRADVLNGIDAWCIMVRQMDHERTIRLEIPRREVRETHTKPIESLEPMEDGQHLRTGCRSSCVLEVQI